MSKTKLHIGVEHIKDGYVKYDEKGFTSDIDELKNILTNMINDGIYPIKGDIIAAGDSNTTVGYVIRERWIFLEGFQYSVDDYEMPDEYLL